MRKDYSSDLTDSQWKQIRKLLNTAYHRHHDLRRDIFDAVLYLVKTGCQWRMLPGGFAPWQTVYYYFRKWKKQGLIGRLLNLARRKAREEADRSAEPTAVMIDCQSVPTTRMGGCSGFDAYKKVKGRKRHVVVDTQGWTWSVKVHAANEHESQHAPEIIKAAGQQSDRLEVVFGDRAYQGELEEKLKTALDLRLEIVSSESEAPGFSVEPKRWVAWSEPSGGLEAGAGSAKNTNGSQQPAKPWFASRRFK